jgi:hypothetical protein
MAKPISQPQADVIRLGVGSFGAEEELQLDQEQGSAWHDDDSGVAELVRRLPLALVQTSAFARLYKTETPADFFGMLDAVERESLESRKVKLHSLSQAAHNGKRGELLCFDAEKERWNVVLDGGEKLAVRSANLEVLHGPIGDCPAESVVNKADKDSGLGSSSAGRDKAGSFRCNGDPTGPAKQRGKEVSLKS